MNNISTPQTQPQLHTLSPSQPVSVDGQYEPLQRVSISIEAPEAKIVEVEYLKVEVCLRSQSATSTSTDTNKTNTRYTE